MLEKQKFFKKEQACWQGGSQTTKDLQRKWQAVLIQHGTSELIASEFSTKTTKQ